MESITAATAAMRYVISPLDRRLIEQLQSELAGVKKSFARAEKASPALRPKQESISCRVSELSVCHSIDYLL